MKDAILLPFRVVDWAMVQAYRGLGLAIVQPLRLLLSLIRLLSGRGALFLGSLLFVAPLVAGVAVGYSWRFALGAVFVLFCLKQTRPLQDGLRKMLGKLSKHFIGIVPPHFNAAEKAEVQALDIPEGSEEQAPPPISSYAHYGIASQDTNETAYEAFQRLPPELQAFVKKA